MATEAQIDANRRNAQASTGPRSTEGKSLASRNAVTFGIYSSGDFVRPEENRVYHLFCEAFHKDLRPAGALEQTLAAEVTHAAWRLRRCSVIESSMLESSMLESGMIEPGMIASVNEPTGEFQLQPMLDPMLAPALAPAQNAIDRARAQAQRQLLRATAELRRLQTERQARIDLAPALAVSHLGGLASVKAVATTLILDLRRQKLQRDLAGVGTPEAITKTAAAQPATPATKRTQSADPQSPAVPRNAPCPCGSGSKYKRCCGPNAPVLGFAA